MRRETAAWQPTDIAGCQLWLKADAGITKDGSNYVSQWADQSGNGNHAVQATGIAQPLWVADGGVSVNNQPVISFDGNDYFSLGDTLDFSTNGQTIYIICKTLNDNSTLISKSFYGSYDSRYSIFVTGLMLYQEGTSPIVTRNITVSRIHGSYHVIKYINDRSTSTHSVYQNNILAGSSAINPSYNMDNDSYYLIGAYNGNGANGMPPLSGLFLQGEIAEIIQYNSAISLANQTLVDTYINSKYGL